MKGAAQSRTKMPSIAWKKVYKNRLTNDYSFTREEMSFLKLSNYPFHVLFRSDALAQNSHPIWSYDAYLFVWSWSNCSFRDDIKKIAFIMWFQMKRGNHPHRIIPLKSPCGIRSIIMLMGGGSASPDLDPPYYLEAYTTQNKTSWLLIYVCWPSSKIFLGRFDYSMEV